MFSQGVKSRLRLGGIGDKKSLRHGFFSAIRRDTIGPANELGFYFFTRHYITGRYKTEPFFCQC